MEHAITVVGIMFTAVMGPALVASAIGLASINALGRNPSSSSKIFVGIVLMLVFAEAASIIALLVVYQLFGKDLVSAGFVLVAIMFVAVIGPAVVIAVIGFATIKALGRNPSAAPKIFMGVSFMLMITEATSITALLVVYQLFGK